MLIITDVSNNWCVLWCCKGLGVFFWICVNSSEHNNCRLFFTMTLLFDTLRCCEPRGYRNQSREKEMCNFTLLLLIYRCYYYELILFVYMMCSGKNLGKTCIFFMLGPVSGEKQDPRLWMRDQVILDLHSSFHYFQTMLFSHGILCSIRSRYVFVWCFAFVRSRFCNLNPVESGINMNVLLSLMLWKLYVRLRMFWPVYRFELTAVNMIRNIYTTGMMVDW